MTSASSGGARRLGRCIGLTLAVTAAVLGAFLALSPADSAAKRGIGNHSFSGNWSFGADGVIEQDGEAIRGFWEFGRFTVDGKGKMTGGVEYSDLLGSDESVVNQPFTFEGTYTVRPDATGTAKVDVTLPNGAVIQKSVWFVLSDFKGGEARGFKGGHLHAELSERLTGRAGLHVGHKVE